MANSVLTLPGWIEGIDALNTSVFTKLASSYLYLHARNKIGRGFLPLMANMFLSITFSLEKVFKRFFRLCRFILLCNIRV